MSSISQQVARRTHDIPSKCVLLYFIPHNHIDAHALYLGFGHNIPACLNLFSDGRNLSSVASLETLHIVKGWTTLSALSAIFRSSTIKDLNLDIRCPVTVSEG